jgi:hypothetical protein
MIGEMQFLASALVLALAAVPAPKPTPTPFAIGTFSPTETPGPPAVQLPEIGRVRSIAPACAAMRDLVIPSFAAAQRADARFVETRKRLPTYADLRDDPEHQNDVFRESALHRLSQDVAGLLQDSLVINKALGDPRLAADSTDPQVQAERAQLEQLYQMQQARANLLSQFVQREQVAVAKGQLTLADSFSKNPGPVFTGAPFAPLPAMTAPPGMPVFSGISLADTRVASDWGTEIANAVRASENAAAKTFLAIARTCR